MTPWYLPQPMPLRLKLTLAWMILTGQFTRVPDAGRYAGQITLRTTRPPHDRSHY